MQRVEPVATLWDAALAWARELAAAPPLAVAGIKRAVYRSGDAAIDAMLALEIEHQMACFESADVSRGLTAFFAKERPRFEGD